MSLFVVIRGPGPSNHGSNGLLSTLKYSSCLYNVMFGLIVVKAFIHVEAMFNSIVIHIKSKSNISELMQ